MSELRKPFLKNQIKKRKKKTENQCQNAACEQKKTTSEKLKFDSNKKIRPRMSCEWIGKTI